MCVHVRFPPQHGQLITEAINFSVWFADFDL